MSIARSSRPLFSITYGITGIASFAPSLCWLAGWQAIQLAAGHGSLTAFFVVGLDRRLAQDVVHNRIFLRLLRVHVEIAIGVLGDPVDWLAGVIGQNLIEHVAGLEDLVGLDLDIGDLAADLAVGLMDHHLRA